MIRHHSNLASLLILLDSTPRSLTDCETKLMTRIVQKYVDSNPSEREPLLHMAVRTGSTAIVEVRTHGMSPDGNNMLSGLIAHHNIQINID